MNFPFYLILVLRYQVKWRDFQDNHGGALLNKRFGGSPVGLLNSVYSDYEFLPWRFSSVSRGFFNDPKNIKLYIDWLKKTVGVKDNSELTNRHFLEHGGGGLLNRFDSSPYKIFLAAADGYETSGKEMKGYTIRNHWTSIEKQLEFLQAYASSMGFDAKLEPLRWYSVHSRDIAKAGGGGLIRRYNGSLYKLLRSVYPDYKVLPLSSSCSAFVLRVFFSFTQHLLLLLLVFVVVAVEIRKSSERFMERHRYIKGFCGPRRGRAQHEAPQRVAPCLLGPAPPLRGRASRQEARRHCESPQHCISCTYLFLSVH